MMTVTQTTMPVQTETLDETMKHFLGPVAEQLAEETAFVRRKRHLTGASYAQGLVFGWLAHPDASYSQLQAMLALLGCEMSAAALEKRLSQPQSAVFFHALLQQLVSQCICTQEVDLAIFEQFDGVYLQDGTIIGLPNELEGLYRGFGGNTASSGRSALRVQVRLNLKTGGIQGPWVQQAVACEREGAGSLRQMPLPTNALYVVDSHYPTLKIMQEMSQQGQWWLTHMKADLVIFDERGVSKSLPQFLAEHAHEPIIDEMVRIGTAPHLRQWVRVLAFRVSPQRAEKRRQQVNASSKTRAKGSRGDVRVGKKRTRASKAGRHRCRAGAKRIAVADWTILLTNVPQQRLSALQARALMRARWQIELLWRLWKERGQVDIWRSQKPWRILSEIFAKLIGLLLQHWLTLLGCWQAPDRSMVKAAMVVGLVAVSYALSWAGPLTSVQVLQACQRAMKRSRLDRSRQHLSTARLLQDPTLCSRLS